MSDTARPITNESLDIIRSGDEPLNAVYRCFDCGESFRGHAKSGSYVGSCRKCEIGMLLVVELDGEPMNQGYFS